MNLEGWVSVIGGLVAAVVGAVIGGVVTIRVYKRQRNDADTWEHLRGDFKSFMLNLDEIEQICRLVNETPQTTEVLRRIEEPIRRLKQIAERTDPGLQLSVLTLTSTLTGLPYSGVDPINDEDIATLTKPADEDWIRSTVERQISRRARNAAEQTQAAYVAVNDRIPAVRAAAKGALGPQNR